MQFINTQIIDSIKTQKFKNQNILELYKKMIGVILNNVCDLLFTKNIDYDYNTLNERLKELTIEFRNGETPEYDEETKTIYVSIYNQLKEKLSAEEQIINVIHELLHFMVFEKNDDSLNEKYFAFDEFFTEYLTYLIAMRVGGKKLESYYNKHPGYCSKHDHQFMRELTTKVDFEQLLTAYFSRNAKKLEEIVPRTVLVSMQDYFIYYANLYYKYNLPKKVINQRLEEDIAFMADKYELEEKLHKINMEITNLDKNNKAY